MSVSRADLDNQVAKDRSLFDSFSSNTKNAIVGELAHFWSKATDVWPEKFVDPVPNEQD